MDLKSNTKLYVVRSLNTLDKAVQGTDPTKCFVTILLLSPDPLESRDTNKLQPLFLLQLIKEQI